MSSYIIKLTINYIIMKHLKQTICLMGLVVLFLAQVPLCVKGEELPAPNADGVIEVTVTATGQFASLYA